MTQRLFVDGLQYIDWTRERFQATRDAGLSAVHVTIAYWENFRQTVEHISRWNRYFIEHSDLILPVRSAEDVVVAQQSNRLGIVFGSQNCSPIEDNLSLVEVLHTQGLRIMQLSYNNQSLLATGCYERADSGITRFGREVIKEMNRVGMVIDMSHSAEESTLQAIALSERPIAITHANPSFFHDALRNKSNKVLDALAESEGIIGFSLYPFHLKNGSECSLSDFCDMVRQTIDRMGIDRVSIGSDLCEGWCYDTLAWMRSGQWTFDTDYGEGSSQDQAWPQQPTWFQNAAGFHNIAQGLQQAGLTEPEVDKVMGLNWLDFFARSFPAASSQIA